MEYSISELSKLAGVSTRTLRYYDEIGLLKPSRISDTGYRYYGPNEVSILQQILFYRERGFELKTIRNIIYDNEFDMLKAMEEHLVELERQKANTESLIQSVKKTIQHMKGKCDMSDKEKFQALKNRMVAENEEKYGQEARKKYGDDQVDASNRNWMNLSEDKLGRWQELDREIIERLEAAVHDELREDSEEAKAIAELHKEWLMISVPNYSREMHRGIAAMYVADERFTKYYDKNTKGCAKLLYEAVKKWI